MRKDVFLVTNNLCFEQMIDSSRLVLVSGMSLDVLIAARDMVHLGDALLTHPLYGNLRPNQQPFRSVLLQRVNRKEASLYTSGCMKYVSEIEEAVLLYKSCGSRLISPESLTDAMRGDYSFVDFELMRESLTQYGLLNTGLTAYRNSWEPARTAG